MWNPADRAELRDYLVRDVEDPRINLQSILTRHFLLEAVFPGRFVELRAQELRFAAVMNWLLAQVHLRGRECLADLHAALLEGRAEMLAFPIPLGVVAAFGALPATVGGEQIENYVQAAILESADEPEELLHCALATFKNLWYRTLTEQPPPAKRLRVLEPACGSANAFTRAAWRVFWTTVASIYPPATSPTPASFFPMSIFGWAMCWRSTPPTAPLTACLCTTFLSTCQFQLLAAP